MKYINSVGPTGLFYFWASSPWGETKCGCNANKMKNKYCMKAFLSE